MSNNKVSLYSKLGIIFEQHIQNIYKELYSIVDKKLLDQQKKIQEQQQKIRYLTHIIEQRSIKSLTSLNSVVQNETNNKVSLQQKRIKSQSMNINNNSSNSEQINIKQIKQALQKLESGINYLSSSLVQSKSNNKIKWKNEIQDPQELVINKQRNKTNELRDNNLLYEQLKQQKSQINTEMTQQTKSTITFNNKTNITQLNKISKLTSQINHLARQNKLNRINNLNKQNQTIKFAQQLSIKQIQQSKESQYFSRFKLQNNKNKISKINQKNISTFNINNRKYYPLSCTKKHSSHSLLLKPNHSQTQLSNIQLDNQSNRNQIIKHYNSQIYLGQYSSNPINKKNKKDDNKCENKMPLINKLKKILNNLLVQINNQSDANIMKYHLKKIYHKLSITYPSDHKPSNGLYNNKSGQYLIKNEQKRQINNQTLNNNLSSCSINKYFSNNTTQYNPINKSTYDQTKPINKQTNLKYLKQNYMHQHHIISNNNNNEFSYKSPLNSSNKNNNYQSNQPKNKPKYFQRTSNQLKYVILKNKLKSNY